ncbi:hypothetical protein [Idiomarina abyssalis]|uniref:hypothetical protein n=1 Tax=Idiomarina abyssalis TaxID=86102 RepID=UPI003A8D91D7
MYDQRRFLNEENLPFPINFLGRFVETISVFIDPIYPRFILDSTLRFDRGNTSIRAFSDDCDFELGLSIQKEFWPDLTLTVEHLHLTGRSNKVFIEFIQCFADLAKEFNYQNLGMSHVPDWLALGMGKPGFRSNSERVHVLPINQPDFLSKHWKTILQ